MKPRVILALGFLCFGAAWGEGADSLTIDDFTSGFHRVTLRAHQLERHVQAGTMLGGFRHTYFRIGQNPYDRPALLEIRQGGLFAESGIRTYDAIDITYGVDAAGQAAPMNLDLSAYDRFRLRFAASDQQHAIAITVYSGVGIAAGELQPFHADPDDVEIPFSAFKGVDFTDVDHIAVVIVDANPMGSSDFGLTRISAVRP